MDLTRELQHELEGMDTECPGTSNHERTEGRFVCDTLAKADWAAQRLKKLRNRQEAVRLVAEEKIKKYQQWADEECAKLDTDASYFESLLEQYLRQEHAANPKAKRVVLPDAVLQLRKKPDTYEHYDCVLLAWVKANAQVYVKTVESVDWAALKKSLKPCEDGSVIYTETGEIVPDMYCVPGEVSFSVEMAPGK